MKYTYSFSVTFLVESIFKINPYTEKVCNTHGYALRFAVKQPKILRNSTLKFRQINMMKNESEQQRCLKNDL